MVRQVRKGRNPQGAVLVCRLYMSSAGSLPYRPEIDGLRALAVAAVILYHLKVELFGWTLLPGGYLGVDVFFVISGYLISRILLERLEQTGRLGLQDFYARRARRILPALAVVLLASTVAGWYLLLPTDYREFSSSALAAVLSVANLFFYFGQTEYGAADNLTIPLLHTWSLGIEEQFYLLFPLICLVVVKWFRRWLPGIFVAGFLVSLLLAEYASSRHHVANFYLPPTRAWEFLAGTLVYLLERRRPLKQLPRIAGALAASSLVVLVVSTSGLDSSTRHPGVATFPVVLASGALILFSAAGSPLRRLLGGWIMTWVGRISYSLYLWHFPVFVFGRYYNDSPGVADKALWLSATLLLSLATYFAVEQPLRSRSRVGPAGFSLVLALLCGGVLVPNSLVVLEDGVASRVPAAFLHAQPREPLWETLRDEAGMTCTGRRDKFCVFGSDRADRTVFLVGDSHMGVMQDDLVARLSDRYRVVVLTQLGCWPLRGYDRYTGKGERTSDCSSERQSRTLDEIAAVPGSIVVLAGRLPLYVEGKAFDNGDGGVEPEIRVWFRHSDDGAGIEAGTRATLNEWLSLGHEVVLVYPIPEVGWDVPRKIYAESPRALARIDDFLDAYPVTTALSTYRERTKKSFEILDSVSHLRIHRVYPHRLFCDSVLPGRCVTNRDGVILYGDSHHPSKDGASLVNDQIMAAIKKIDR